MKKWVQISFPNFIALSIIIILLLKVQLFRAAYLQMVKSNKILHQKKLIKSANYIPDTIDFTLNTSIIKLKRYSVADIMKNNFNRKKQKAERAKEEGFIHSPELNQKGDSLLLEPNKANNKDNNPKIESSVKMININNNNNKVYQATNDKNEINVYNINKNAYSIQLVKKNIIAVNQEHINKNRYRYSSNIYINDGMRSSSNNDDSISSSKNNVKKNTNKNINIGFFQEFLTSFSLNFFSEIGDKSFIAVFLLINQITWFTLFIVASITEISVNLFSVLIGYSLRAYEKIYFILIYITIFTTLLYGILLLKESILDSDSSYYKDEEEEEKMKILSRANYTSPACSLAKESKEEQKNLNSNKKLDGEFKEKKSENKVIFTILKISWFVILSELGDKSQIVTIILSTHHNPYAVFLGTAIAHVLGVLLSILLGSFVSSKLNTKIMSFIAGLCFISYGLYVSASYFLNKEIFF